MTFFSGRPATRAEYIPILVINTYKQNRDGLVRHAGRSVSARGLGDVAVIALFSSSKVIEVNRSVALVPSKGIAPKHLNRSMLMLGLATLAATWAAKFVQQISTPLSSHTAWHAVVHHFSNICN